LSLSNDETLKRQKIRYDLQYFQLYFLFHPRVIFSLVILKEKQDFHKHYNVGIMNIVEKQKNPADLLIEEFKDKKGILSLLNNTYY